MGREAFHQLVERVQKSAIPAGTTTESARARASKTGVRAKDGAEWSYRPCAICGELMNRRNYGRDSGIIIDVCGDHGVWFDADELARILTWIRAGGGRKTGADDALPDRRAGKKVRLQRGESDEPFSIFGALISLLSGAPF